MHSAFRFLRFLRFRRYPTYRFFRPSNAGSIFSTPHRLSNAGPSSHSASENPCSSPSPLVDCSSCLFQALSPFNHLSKPDAGLFIPDIPASCPRQQPARHRPRTNACTRHFIQHDPPSKSPRTTEASPFNKPRPTLLRTRTSSPSSYKGGDTQFLCARRHARPSRVIACRRGL